MGMHPDGIMHQVHSSVSRIQSCQFLWWRVPLQGLIAVAANTAAAAEASVAAAALAATVAAKIVDFNFTFNLSAL